ncbi:MAG: nitroreductase family protein [Christensenellaceae bacterium]
MNDNSKAHVNDVIKTMLERSSIRAYTDEKLTQEQISLLQNAALSAPTAMNAQDQRFVFVTNAEIIAELEAGVVEAACAGGDAAFAERVKQRGGKIMYDAPLFVGIFAHPAKFSGVDAGIAVQNIALAAKSIGLDSVILGCRGSLLKARMRQNTKTARYRSGTRIHDRNFRRSCCNEQTPA